MTRQFCNKLSTCGFEKQDDRSARDVPKSLLTCRAKLPHEKKNGVFNRASSSSWQAFGQLGRAVENLAVRSALFLVRSRQCESGWVEIRVFLCL